MDGEVVGRVVISKSGRDKGEYYVIVSVLDDKHAGIANGISRTMDAPKKKNLRHLCITNSRVPEFASLIKAEKVSANLKLASVLKREENGGRR